MSMTCRSKPTGRVVAAPSCEVPGAVPGVCCGGTRMPPCVVLTTGAVLSAGEWSVLVRLRNCCACWAASCSRSSGENGSSSVDGESDGGLDGMPPIVLLPVPVPVPVQASATASARDRARSGKVCADGAVVRSDQAPRDAPRPDGDVAAACELVISPPTELERRARRQCWYRRSARCRGRWTTGWYRNCCRLSPRPEDWQRLDFPRRRRRRNSKRSPDFLRRARPAS